MLLISGKLNINFHIKFIQISALKEIFRLYKFYYIFFIDDCIIITVKYILKINPIIMMATLAPAIDYLTV